MIKLLTREGNFATLSAMTRQWRIEFEGAYYHILSRGNERRNIFTDNDDRISFLEILGKMSERFEVDVYAYVLMNNHYHLLLKTNKPNISKGMQWFGTTYTRRYNVKHKRNGHLFQGRFKNFLVENDEYLMLLSCYIHRNPLRAGIVRRLVDYPWSSYPVYAYGKKSPEWLRTAPILSHFNTKNKLEKAAKILKCNTNDFLQSPRICHSDKLNRDLLIYILWNTGWYNNKEIGNLFGLGYSSISRRVTIMKSMMLKDGEIHKQLEEIKSLIKV